MKTGIFPSMARADYDAEARTSFSRLKKLAQSPRHYRHALAHPEGQTDARRLGEALHLAVLEPDRYSSAIALWESGDRRGKAWAAFAEENASRLILKPHEDAEVKAMAASCRADSHVAEYLSGQAEVSLLWDADGTPMKSRVDMVCADGALLDLKKTTDASPEGFGRAAWGYAYHAQAACYSDAWHLLTGEVRPFVFLAVEGTAPYCCALYVVPDEARRAGREAYQGWLRTLRACEASGEWPGYLPVDWLRLPKWSGAAGEGFDEDSTQEEA